MNKMLTAGLLGLALMVVAPVAAAERPTDTGTMCQGLSQAQCDIVVAEANKLKEQAAPAAVSAIASANPGKFKEWVDVGTALGAALGESLVTIATRLGIAVNEFAKSDVGRVAIWLLVWHIAGQAILSTGIGLTFFFVSTGIVIYLVKKMMTSKYEVNRTWSGEKTWYGRPIIKTEVTVDRMSTEDKCFIAFMGFVGWMIVIWVTSVIIF